MMVEIDVELDFHVGFKESKILYALLSIKCFIQLVSIVNLRDFQVFRETLNPKPNPLL